MKHHFGPWTYTKECAETVCTRCGAKARVAQVGGTKFLVNGKWVRKFPCTGGKKGM